MIEWLKCVSINFGILFGPLAAILLTIGVVASALIALGFCLSTGGTGCLAIAGVWGLIVSVLGAFAAAILLLCIYTCTFGGAYGGAVSSAASGTTDTGTSGAVSTAVKPTAPIIVRGFQNMAAKAVAIVAGAEVILSMI